MNFMEFAQSHGLEIRNLFVSDRIQRCGTIDKPRSDNGSYFYDGRKGWVQNWESNAQVVWWEDAKPWTPEEKELYLKRRQISMQVSEKKHTNAVQKAEELLKSCKMDHHGYLDYKGFREEKGLVLDDVLMIPMRNVATNALQGIQQICWDAKERKYNKKMLAGMKAKDAVFFLGNNKDETFLVEGYVTGLSVYQALRLMGLKGRVCVCFSAANLVNVADKIGSKRYIFADNDASKTGEEYAKKTGLPWIMADQEGWDANDLHYNKGIFELIQKINELRQK